MDRLPHFVGIAPEDQFNVYWMKVRMSTNIFLSFSCQLLSGVTKMIRTTPEMACLPAPSSAQCYEKALVKDDKPPT